MKLELEGGLLLSSVSTADAAELFAVVDSNRAYLAEWLPWVPLNTAVSDTEAFIQDSHEKVDRGELSSVLIRENGAILGVVSLFNISSLNRCAEVGYWLSEAASGRGVMTRSAGALIAYGFEELSLNRIQLCAATRNVKSQAVAERLGFVREGVVREGERLKEAYVDLVLFSLLASDRSSQPGSRRIASTST